MLYRIPIGLVSEHTRLRTIRSIRLETFRNAAGAAGQPEKIKAKGNDKGVGMGLFSPIQLLMNVAGMAGLEAFGLFNPEHEQGLKAVGGLFVGDQTRCAVRMNNRCAQEELGIR
jgi:hypothetical protein